MNTQILQKCIEELKQTNPKIDYILGMLETVVAMSAQPPQYPPMNYPSTPSHVIPYGVTTTLNEPMGIEEEGSGILRTYATGPVATVE
jgi:hypothetical protein